MASYRTKLHDMGQHETVLLRIAEAGAELRVSKATVYRLIASGDLPVVHVGARRASRIRRDDLAAYIARNVRQDDAS